MHFELEFATEQSSFNISNFGSLSYDNVNSFVDYGDRQGIFLDRDSTGDDKLKYSGVNLYGDYILEAVVSGKSLYGTGARYIIHNGVMEQGLNLSTSGANKLYRVLRPTVQNFQNPLTINPNHFYKIVFKKTDIGGMNTQVEIYNQTTGVLLDDSFNINTNINFNTLYVGSKYNYTNNLGGVVDYIKIYSK